MRSVIACILQRGMWLNFSTHWVRTRSPRWGRAERRPTFSLLYVATETQPDNPQTQPESPVRAEKMWGLRNTVYFALRSILEDWHNGLKKFSSIHQCYFSSGSLKASRKARGTSVVLLVWKSLARWLEQMGKMSGMTVKRQVKEVFLNSSSEEKNRVSSHHLKI